MKKKIGIIGSGSVGQTLATGFLKFGFEVMIGSRELSKLAEWKSKSSENGHIGSFEEAASFGEILILAVKGSAAVQALEMAGKGNFSGKIVIDTTNPIADLPPVNGVLRFFSEMNYSLMEKLQQAFPEALLVKAFNSVGSSQMVNPDFGDFKPTLFICGNDQPSKNEVAEIVGLFGFEPEDLGSVEASGAIESLCMLWCIRGFRENRWSHAFRLLKH